MSQPSAATPSVKDAPESIIFPPGDIYSDEPPLESDLHREQIDLLIRLIKWWWRDRQNFYATGNLTIYFSPNQKKSEEFRGPDFFVVLDAEKKDRKSWLIGIKSGFRQLNSKSRKFTNAFGVGNRVGATGNN